jgi:carbon monoxide dehydrogenase subunit G
MNMTGEQRIAAPRQRVWEALNDPEILKASIPGCQTLTKESDTRFTATVEVKVGPIGARFKGAVSLEDIRPANGYTLLIEGNGGIAGSMKGSARVALSDDADGTLIRYEVDAQVGGRMAQLGGPIIDATAKQLAGKFFGRFGELVGGVKPIEPATAARTALTAASPAATTAQRVSTASDSRWAGIAIGLLLIVVAAAAFEFGRRAATPVIALDSALLRQMVAEAVQQELRREGSKHSGEREEQGRAQP